MFRLGVKMTAWGIIRSVRTIKTLNSCSPRNCQFLFEIGPILKGICQICQSFPEGFVKICLIFSGSCIVFYAKEKYCHPTLAWVTLLC